MGDLTIKIDPGMILYYNKKSKPEIICPHCKRWNNIKPLLDEDLKCPECKRQYTLEKGE